MAPRSRDIYRGKRRWRFPVTLIVSILLVLVVAAVVLFYALQKYVVYDKDGVTLAIPGLTAPASAAPDTDATVTPVPSQLVDVEIVVVEPDYSDVDLQPGGDLTTLHGVYVSASELSGGLTAGLQRAGTLGADSLVLELQTADGTLLWASGSELATGFGLAGQADLPALVAAAREAGLYTVAELHCCLNTLLARRSPSIALKNAGGAPYEDARGGWLDPYNLTVRSYLLSLMQELADAGFDEILLTDLSFPEKQDLVSWSQDLLGTTTPRAAVSGLAVYLAENAPEGVRVSAMLEAEALADAGGDGQESVQDAALFARLFDRLYLRTGSDNLASDAAALARAAGADMSLRFVPVMSAAPEAGCWAVEGTAE